jgi:RNA ligase (TIGR02306 family)
MAVVDGWRSACRIGDFAAGQKVAYIPEGVLLPAALITELGLDDPPRLAGRDANRVKAIRMRGVLSQGIIYAGSRLGGLNVGDDAAEALGLLKWEPEIPDHLKGTVVPGPKIGFDVDDIKAWPDRLQPAEPVVITEKLHGTFCCLGLRRQPGDTDVQAVVTSRGHLNAGRCFDLGSADNAGNPYVDLWRHYEPSARALFDAWNGHSRDPFEMDLFGELCGPGLQDLTYGLTVPEFYLFDVRLAAGYENWETVREAAAVGGFLTVPELHRGAWSADLLAEYTEGGSTLAAHHREGIVVRPLVDRYDTGADHPSGRGPGRVMFKSLSVKHLMRKGGTEHH